VATTRENEVKLYDLINDVEIAMLTTVEPGGGLHTRPMANQEADENGDIWFFTDKTTSVATNIKANPKLSLGYSNASNTYVAIAGTGMIVDDRAKIDELWSDELKAWFPKGKNDPDLTLLRVTPERGEFWDAGSSTIVSTIGYLRAKLTGGNADDFIDNEKVQLKR
jgi:general stress protein 26